MKPNYLRYSLMAAALLCLTTAALAKPALNKAFDLKQPDGTIVSLVMHGDEFLHFMTTTDGYTVVRNHYGYYCYADKHNGQLVATTVKASNPADRQPAEQQFLAARSRMTVPQMTEGQMALKQSAATLYAADRPGLKKAAAKAGFKPIDYSKFRGLVLLVEFKNRKFLNSNPKQFYQTLTNTRNLTSFTDNNGNEKTCTGSVRDYFYDNSMGKFDPQLDVVGPIQISYNDVATKGGDNMKYVISAAINNAKEQVDFSNYDLNGDKVVDMVYFIFAGYGSYVPGNNSDYLWPHAASMKYFGLGADGMRFDRYACSVELQDLEEQAEQHQNIDGIGTMCHEFSHVLGLADHYDTDYEQNGQANHPGFWDLMASGGELNSGFTPIGYNAYERYTLGFAPLQQLDVAGDYELEPINTSNQFFLIKTGTTYEDIYIENRQRTGWDSYAPGHGMLVWRVDSTNSNAWADNTLNANADHLYYDLIRSTVGNTVAGNLDTYPGTNNIVDLTATTTPSLTSWYGQEAVVDLYDIAESADGIISFKAGKNIYPSAIENFEAMEESTTNVTGIQGAFCLWDLTSATIGAVADGNGYDDMCVTVKRNGTLTSSVLDKPIRSLSFHAWTGKQKVLIATNVFVDGKWQPLKEIGGSTLYQLLGRNDAQLNYRERVAAGTKIQIKVSGTSNSAVAYIDNISISYYNEVSGVADITVDRIDGTAYSLSGQRVASGYRGIIIRDGKKCFAK